MAISITTHGQYLTQIEKSTILFPINCYLVREDDGLTLVDTNWTKMADAILAAAKQLGAPIRRIALTHVHGDHVGSLDPLYQALPDADVLVGAREARLLARDFSLDPDEAQGKPRGDYPVGPVLARDSVCFLVGPFGLKVVRHCFPSADDFYCSR